MAAATTPSTSPAAGGGVAPAQPVRLLRFALVERLLHWANAALFLVLIATAAVLYVAPLSALVGRRPLVRDVHVIAGVLLPLPWLVARWGPWSAPLRADVRRMARFDAFDRRWIRSLGRDPFAALGKFHPLQKLNAAFTAGSIPVMLGTGAVMRWFHWFPLEWRTGATFVHDWVSLALFVIVAVHIAKALSDREALRGMWVGDVDPRWARRRHPRWYDEASTRERTETAGPALKSSQGGSET
jgi:formate dehydrogenase subunit gamma